MSILFILIIVAGLPLLSALSYKNIKQLEAENEGLQFAKTPIYLQSIALQSVLALLAFFAARSEHIQVSLHSTFTVLNVVSGIAFIGIALLVSYLSDKFGEDKDEGTLHHLLPETISDRIWWIIACIVAAFCEEYVYRGVLFGMMMEQTGNIWLLATAISAVVFAFGHGTQGEKAILQIIPFAIGFHVIAYLGNGLLLVMIIHFFYNILVDLFFGAKIKQKAQR